ncbi:hypothetical protein GCM10010218_20140 [Streptomyces mashuensis]|uniref:Uncharacterized protein n=1 Tax=Streptomyces mashuensis TaxID=33904 RepID=A0A919EB08_9ACTN|nr:hypothetical protein [Streptomyces mashuensis]GHF38865.1 hypothetical protein GCM10010218_20140 [Streptomyces mashuensis]
MRGTADLVLDNSGSRMLRPDTDPRGFPSTRLAALRRTVFEDAIQGHNGTVKVALYALTTLRADPDPAFDAARTYAEGQRWSVLDDVFWDNHGMTDPAERPGWQAVRKLIAGGFARGIVTVSRSAVSTADREYERELEWLHERRAFLAHVPRAAVLE